MLPSFPFSPFLRSVCQGILRFVFATKLHSFLVRESSVTFYFKIISPFWKCVFTFGSGLAIFYAVAYLIYKQQCKQNTRKKWKKAKKWTYASWINLIYLQIFSTFLPRDVLEQKITPFSQKNAFYLIKKSTSFRKK